MDVNLKDPVPGITDFPSINLSREDLDAELNIGLEQLLYDGGRTEAVVMSAEMEEENYRMKLEEARDDVAYNVALAFYSALKAKEKLKLSEENIKGAEENLKLAQALFNEGLVPEVDAVTAEVALAKAKTLSNQARNEYDKATGNLNMAMGCNITDSLELKGDVTYIPFEIDEEKAIEKALSSRTELNRLDLFLEGKEAGLNIAEMAFSPTISANAGYIIRDSDSMGKRDFYVGLGVNFPVFNIAEYRAKSERALATLEEGKKQRQLLEQQITLEVHNALLDLKSSQQNIEITQEEVELAELSLKISRGRYEQGLGTILELTQSQLNLMKAQADYTDSVYNYKIALLTVENAMGSKIEDLEKGEGE